MIVSFLFILTMLNRYVCKYTIYMYNIYTIYSIVYKKKKEESKEERRNNRLSDYSILGFLGSGNRVILSHIAEWGLFHSCSFKLIMSNNQQLSEEHSMDCVINSCICIHGRTSQDSHVISFVRNCMYERTDSCVCTQGCR